MSEKKEMDERAAAKLEMLVARQKPNHEHCWHMHRGPIWMVIPDGHVVQKCCKCPHTRTIHSDHMFDGHLESGNIWRRSWRGSKPKLSVSPSLFGRMNDLGSHSDSHTRW